MLLRTCWHRNFILLALVCMCWNGSVAHQKKRENEHNEPSTESIPRVSTNATTPAPTPPEDTGLELEQPRKTSGILNLGCEGIRIRRYVSNGRCTSRRPIRDMICDGQCLPMDELPWFPEFSKIISRHKREWRCVADDVRTRKVTVMCNDGTKHKYRVRVVRSCKCKRYTHKQNQTNPWQTRSVHNNKEQNLQWWTNVKRHPRTDGDTNIPSLYCSRL